MNQIWYCKCVHLAVQAHDELPQIIQWFDRQSLGEASCFQINTLDVAGKLAMESNQLNGIEIGHRHHMCKMSLNSKKI